MGPLCGRHIYVISCDCFPEVDPGVGEALEGVVAIDHAVRRERVAVVELHIGGNTYPILYA